VADIFSAEEAAAAVERLRKSHEPSRIYSRAEVFKFFEQHRRGELSGAEWVRLEFLLIRAGAEGRILGGLDINDRGEKGPSR
jgi:hypothetical protein